MKVKQAGILRLILAIAAFIALLLFPAVVFAATLNPPTDFLAVPVSSSEIGLSWETGTYENGNGGPKSFVPGTLCALPCGVVRIENLGIGDTVLSVDLNSGRVEAKPVTAVRVGEAQETRLVYVGEEAIECTPGHLFRVADGGWVPAVELKVGDYLQAYPQAVQILRIEDVVYPEPIRVFDLTVEGNGNFLVGMAHILVHNQTIKTGVWVKLGSYPDSRTDEDATQIYFGTAESYDHKGLSPGTSYYYRAWSYYEEGEEWSTSYDQDFATTLMGKGTSLTAPMPPEWFQTPECTAYESLPFWDGIEGFADGWGIPLNNFCVLLTLGGIMGLTFVGWLISRTALITLAIPFVFIIVASIAGLLPMWMLAIDVVLGGLLIYMWVRA